MSLFSKSGGAKILGRRSTPPGLRYLGCLRDQSGAEAGLASPITNGVAYAYR